MITVSWNSELKFVFAPTLLRVKYLVAPTRKRIVLEKILVARSGIIASVNLIVSFRGL